MEDEDFRKIKELVENTVNDKFGAVSSAIESVKTEISILKDTFVSTNIYESARDEKVQLAKDVATLKDELKELGEKSSKLRKQVADEALADILRQQVKTAPK